MVTDHRKRRRPGEAVGRRALNADADEIYLNQRFLVLAGAIFLRAEWNRLRCTELPCISAKRCLNFAHDDSMNRA